MLKYILILSMFMGSSLSSMASSWFELEEETRHELITELEYVDAPKGTKVVQIFGYEQGEMSVYSTYEGVYSEYVNKMIEEFHDEVSTEAIEQSYYSSVGDAEITELFLLVEEKSDRVLGAAGRFYQEGVDDEGESNDISWSTSFQTDENVEALEDYYHFEWSGH